MPRTSRQPEAGPAEEILAGCFSGRIRMLNRAITGLYDDALRPAGVTTGQLTTLGVIERLGPVAPGALARALKMEKSTVSRSLARMERNGWITISPCDAGRTQAVEIARKGSAALASALPRWREAQERTRRLLGKGGAAALVKAFESARSHDRAV